ncbi:MAG: dihydrofolate reductase family protein [Acidimicrobiales bacterium]|nr:dihydrofolate reductase family protein [Acidimicrobiales bacterium]
MPFTPSPASALGTCGEPLIVVKDIFGTIWGFEPPFGSWPCQHRGVHQIFPPPATEVDPGDVYHDERPLVGDRPWLMVNMVSTIDGVTDVDGVSAPLGGPGDKDIFGTIRTLPDIILVGSTTAVSERYNPPSTSVSTKARRLANGAWPVARIAVVSGRLDFDLTLPMFQRPAQRPIVVTTVDADPVKVEKVSEHADLIQCGNTSVDLPQALRDMAGLGAHRVLSEGGPSLNGALLRAGLIDEVFLSVSPLMGGGDSRGIARGDIPHIQELILRHVLTEDHFLFLRYSRAT